MRVCWRGMQVCVLLLATILFVPACGGEGGGGNGNTPPTIDPPAPQPTVNVNITNPSLTVVNNTAVSPGGTLNLVWSDEFDGSQLDPELWFFEEGDGSQYGIPGWGNDELQWDETEMRWYVDDALYAMQNSWSSTSAPFPAPFDQPFYLLLNVAVGGNWPGSPDAGTVFPVTMEVDYVRVYSGNP